MPAPILLNFLAKGALIGLSIAAPVGPIGVLCIRRTLEHGRRAGLASGIGAAVADTLYGCVAGFGLTAISDALIFLAPWLNLGGGAFLCVLGLRTMLRAPKPAADDVDVRNLGSAFASTLVLTLANPMTILSFVAVFAGFGLARTPSYAAAGTLVAGVFFGSALWFLFLTGLVAHLRRRMSDSWLRFINRSSGFVITAFGVYALWVALAR